MDALNALAHDDDNETLRFIIPQLGRFSNYACIPHNDFDVPTVSPVNHLTKPQKLLLLAASLSIAVWAIPVARYLILPLAYLNTHFHELFHALAALATGGMPGYILVHADGSGLTPVVGGSALLVASAGYPGTAILGCILILTGRKPETATKALQVLSILLGFSLLTLVRGDIIGILSAILWIPALWFAATKLKADNLTVFTQFLGVQLCLTAIQSLFTLLNISAATDTHSDARILQELTLIPDVAWAALWTGFSLFLIFLSLKRAWRPVRN